MAKPPNNNEFPTVSWSGSPEGGEGSDILPQVKDYEIVNKLGEGGMGIVYLAEQKEPIKRQVALKIIKPGMDSAKVISRFETERQTLALLDHPNIARVFEAGTTQLGRPYFAMEYVKGIRITDYCDLKRLNIEKRLELFTQVCQAIQHAHQKGFIHRDIKPSNILVSTQDGQAIPKIIDFGVAKALSQQLTERTMFTEEGQLIGTPEYMSPEQTDLANYDIDTRTDIYSLGVLLYELLTGVLPFDPKTLRQAAFEEIQRVIREQDPPRPSTKLSSLDKEAQEIVQNRQTELPTLVKRLYKELEWIPLKAMRKERSHRYQSASEFADDIRNYLDGNPLIAGPESVAYRVKKFARKHTGPIVSVVGVLVVLIAGLVVSATMYFQAEDSRLEAVQAKELAEKQREVAVQAQKEAEKRTEELRIASYIDKIHRTDKELAERNYYNAYQLLTSCPDNLRGWEWHQLWRTANSAGTIIDVGRAMQDVLFTSDGKQIISSSHRGIYGGTIHLFEVATGNVVETFDLHDKRLMPIAFSPDGKRIACWATYNATIQLLDVATQDKIRSFNYQFYTTNKSWPSYVVFSPDGNKIAVWSGKGDEPIKLLDVATGSSVDFAGHNQRIGTSYHCPIALSPDGNMMASGGVINVKLWNVQTASVTRTFDARGPKIVVAFSPDSQLIVTGDMLGRTNIWDVETGEKLREFTAESGNVEAVAFSPNGQYIASGNYRGRITVWDVESGDEILDIRGLGKIWRIGFSPDGRQIFSRCKGIKGIGIWPLKPESRMKTLNRSQRWCMAIDPDGAYICLDDRNVIKLWDIVSETAKLSLPIEGGWWKGDLAFSSDEKQVLAVSYNSGKAMIHIWDLVVGSELRRLPIEDVTSISAISFSNDGKHIMVGGAVYGSMSQQRKREFAIVDMTTGSYKAMFEIKSLTAGDSRWIAFSPNGKYIAACTSDGIIVWDFERRTKLAEIPTRCNYAVAFSSDGERIVSCGASDTALKIWDANSGIELKSIDNGGPAWSVAFSPDGSRIISGGYYGTIKIWDSKTGTELLALDAQSPVRAVAFSPDGKQVLARCAEAIRIWNTVDSDQNNIQPRDAEAYYDRGIAHFNKSEFSQAISNFTKALELNPRFAGAYNRRSISYYYKGEYDRAISDCNKALEIDPNYADAYNDRGISYHYKGEYDRAISDYNKAIELNPRLTYFYYDNRGTAYYYKGEYDQAILDYNKAIQINPVYHKAYYNRGLTYSKKAEYDQAISDYNKVLESTPRDTNVYYKRADAYYHRGEYDKAWEDVQKAESLGYMVPQEFLKALREASGRDG